MLFTPAQIKPQSFESRRNSLFFTRGGCASCLSACLGARLLPQSYQYPNLSEGADRVGGQLRGDKECPFSGVTKSGRVWRKVPESDARSVGKSPSRSTARGSKKPFISSGQHSGSKQSCLPAGKTVWGVQCLYVIIIIIPVLFAAISEVVG